MTDVCVCGRNNREGKVLFKQKGQFGTIANGHKVNTHRLETRKIYFIVGMVIRIKVAENLIAFKGASCAFRENVS